MPFSRAHLSLTLAQTAHYIASNLYHQDQATELLPPRSRAFFAQGGNVVSGNEMQIASGKNQEAAAGEPSDQLLPQLNAEVCELVLRQVFSSGELMNEAEVCRAFSALQAHYWELCCLFTYLVDEGGRLSASTSHTAGAEVDGEQLQRAADWLARVVEEQDGEQQFWLDQDTPAGNKRAAEAREVFAEAGVRAGLAVPVHVSGALVGAVVSVTPEPDTLRRAIDGLRLIAGPVLIALGNARRAAAMNEQRRHIERLVEELQQRTSALEEANRELQRVGRYRSLFLARMSHELRTPLTSMLGFAEILLEHGELVEGSRRFCEKIQSSGFQLQLSLNQLVDLSRLEAGQAELFLHEFSLREMLRESCAAVRRLAQKQDVEIDCDLASVVGTIVSDEGKLRQALYNFLAHAISRSPSGGHVGLQLNPTTPSRFRLAITDEGESLADPAHLFDPIDIDAPSDGGTNMNELGLVIAHRLIIALGGTVALGDVDASPHGLTVSLELPTRPTEN